MTERGAGRPHEAHGGRERVGPTPMPTSDVDKLMREFGSGTPGTFSIGPVTWHVPPALFSEDTAYVSYDALTAAGWAVFEYGAKPTEYTISGNVGNAGQKVLHGGIADLLKLKPPPPGRARPTYPMRWPGVFPGVKYVKVVDWQHQLSNDRPYTHTYALVVREYPPALSASAVLVGDEGRTTALPLFGAA